MFEDRMFKIAALAASMIKVPDAPLSQEHATLIAQNALTLAGILMTALAESFAEESD